MEVIQNQVSINPVFEQEPQKNNHDLVKAFLISVLALVFFTIISVLFGIILLGINCNDGCGLEGFAYFLVGPLLSFIVTLITLTFFAKKFIKSNRYIMLTFVFFIALLIGVGVLGQIFKMQQIRNLEDTMRKDFQPYVTNAKNIRLVILDISETPIFDEEGFIESLSVKVKIESNNDIEINDPFWFAVINPNYHVCASTEYNKSNTIKLKSGINEISTTATAEDLKIEYPFFKGEILGTYMIKLNFSAYIPPVKDHFGRERNMNTGNANVIENIVNSSNLPLLNKCNMNDDPDGFSIDPAFESNLYKMNVKVGPQN